ncbi:MAG TPA: TonB-dependent receptor [Flavisolibacter sp.]|nr:TonB-dependent receptor [Flavisolibacter sp.]
MKTFGYLLIAVLYSSLSYGQACGLRLTGHVHSTASHENLGSASITLSEKGKTLITNEKGNFVFDSLCPGTYTILVSHASYGNTTRTITLRGNTTHTDLDLSPTNVTLSEVTVTGARGLASTGQKKELSGRELEESRGGTISEALSNLNGVALLQTGSTISKPVIHGLHSNRILTINNGVRQEGQQWGNEHAPEIDPFIANRLTVIKGVDELRYGSDAIGGVILVEPRALRSTPGWESEVNAVYFTNNQQLVASAIYEQQLKALPAFTYRLQGSVKRGANVTTPHYRLNNTAVAEGNFSLAAGWRREHFNTEAYYSLFSTRAGIFAGAHVGNLADLEQAIASERPAVTFTGQRSYGFDRPYQNVLHQLLKSKTGFDINGHKFNILLAGQYNQRQEFDVLPNAAGKGAQINLSILTTSEEITWEHPRISNFTGVVGAVALQQDNTYGGRYLIPNYNARSFGAYALEKWAREKWNVEAGIRFDDKNINTSRLQSASQTFTAYQFHFSTLASSLNAGYKLTPQWKVNANVALSTRAPHVNELLTNGIHHGAGTYEQGNINLKPEQSLHYSINSLYTGSNKLVSAEVTLYTNRINDFIFQQPRPEEPVLTIRGAFPKIVYEQTDALLQGLDLSTGIQIHPRLLLTTKYSMLRARNKRINDWLIGMPSDRLGNELTYSLKETKRFTSTYFSVELQNVAKQRRVPSDKNGKQDYKAPPAGYALLNAHFSTSIPHPKRPLTLGVGVTNILNRAYRDYLNSFRYFTDAMGRNISLRLKIGLHPVK